MPPKPPHALKATGTPRGVSGAPPQTRGAGSDRYPAAKATRLAEIGLGGINVRPGRLRALRPEVVADIAKSFKEIGQIQPVIIRPRDNAAAGNGYWLVAGRHRLEAARKLKWESIRADIRDGAKADQAELIEIDENLCRADLSPAERALHVARRKELYEAQHPETKHGKAPAKRTGKGGKLKAQNEHSTFVADTAAKTGKGRSSVQRDATRGKTVAVLADIVGTSLDQGSEIDALSKLPEKEQQKLAKRAKAGEKVSAKTRVKQVKRQDREQKLAKKVMALPDQKFAVILCDDEWDHEVYSRETGMDRHAANHYETASDAHTAAELHERTKDRFICAADDCVLFMWSTIQHLDVAIDLLRLRGFRYVSNYVWGKDKIGLGYWSRSKHEHLLIGVRGNIPCPAPGTQCDSLIMAPVGKHSAKPERFLEMIEQYFPNLPKIEINRRGTPRPGWQAWGNEVTEAQP